MAGYCLCAGGCIRNCNERKPNCIYLDSSGFDRDFDYQGAGEKSSPFCNRCGAAVVIVLAIVAGSTGVLERFADISLSASTFLGRLLYARDAIPLILQHPFGLGYYGYYYIQQSIQTGVYSVVNVHNELLQMFLDVGVIPAVLMSAAVLRSVLAKHTNARNRLVLVILILHSLFDYDFQFLVMGFVLILFLDMRNIKTYKVPALTGTVLGIAGAGSVVFAVFAGLSDLMYTTGNYERAFAIYNGNTQAETALSDGSRHDSRNERDCR